MLEKIQGFPGWWWNGQLSDICFQCFGRNTRTLNENHSWWIRFYIDGSFLYFRFSLPEFDLEKFIINFQRESRYRRWFCRTQACSKSCLFWLRCVFNGIFNLFCRFFTFSGIKHVWNSKILNQKIQTFETWFRLNPA